jgi:hypothetical protein
MNIEIKEKIREPKSFLFTRITNLEKLSCFNGFLSKKMTLLTLSKICIFYLAETIDANTI